MKEILGAADNALMKITGDYAPARWRTAAELWMILYLTNPKRTNRPAQGTDLFAWLQACQNNDGGFGFLPRTASFIENCHTCLRALAFLNAFPLDPGGCHAFIAACRTGSGGFARIHGATAFLDATWHAVASRSLLTL
jgi:prenyltransferase beta subunit